MLEELLPLGSWLLMLGCMIYGALHPERLVAARRAVASDHPLTRGEVNMVRAMVALVVAICLWVGYATGNTQLPLIFISASVALWIVVEIARRRSGLARLRLPIRFAGACVLAMAIIVHRDKNIYGYVLAVVATAIMIFPALWSRVANLGMSEEREIARTRWSGILGAIIAVVAVAFLGSLILRNHSRPRSINEQTVILSQEQASDAASRKEEGGAEY